MAAAQEAHLRAQQAIQSGDYARAEQVLAMVNRDPATRRLDNLMLHAQVLSALQQYASAAAVLEAAEKRAGSRQDKAQILNMAADFLCGHGPATEPDIRRAIDCLERAVSIDPRPVRDATRRNLCGLYFRLEEFEDCRRHARELVDHPEHAARACLWLASCNVYLNQKDEGESSLERALELAGSMNDADLGWLIETLLNYRRYDVALELIDKVLAAGSGAVAIRNAQVRLHYEQRDYARVLELTTDDLLHAASADAEPKMFACFMRGRALDAVGRYDEAHECFLQMNRYSLADYPPPVARDFTQAYTGVDLAVLPDYPLSEATPFVPTFMVAFPRSGTTLLDTILDTQREITLLSETECMFVVRNAMEAFGRRYPEDLSRLTKEEVEQLRAVYFSEIKPYLSADQPFGVLIDKVPLYLLHLPLIRTLFPGARIIFSLRHPLDVCLSCFQQGFKLNDEMLHFTDLEKTFRRYRDVMQLFQRFRDELDLNLLTVRYEDLVEDLPGTAGRVFEFLGVDPSDDYRRFHEINREKFSATPSRDQVTQPLYKSSKQRWRNYEQYILPHVDIVRPFIEDFGYEV